LGTGLIADCVALAVEDEYEDEGFCCWAPVFGPFVRPPPSQSRHLELSQNLTEKTALE
jgi:hypothetical protein